MPDPSPTRGRKLALAYFLNTDVRAGVEEHVLSLLRRLSRERFAMSLVAPPTLLELYGNDVPDDVQVVPLELAGASARAAASLYRFLRRERIDIVHSHMFQASRYASPLARLAGTPVVLETPHVNEQWRKGWIKGRFFIDRWVARSVDYFIAVSYANATYLAHTKGIPAEKVAVIQNGRDLAQFRPEAVPAAELERCRAEAGVAAGEPTIAVFARLEPQKGHRVLLDALPRLLAAIPNLRVLFAGDGAARGELEQQARTLGVEKNVRFLGYRRDVQRWMAFADVVVLPSFYEGLPLVAVEALAMEKAVVATAVDGTPEVVVNGETGLTVPAGDATALANAVALVLSNPELRHRLGRAGRKHALENFTEELQVARTEWFYCRAFEASQLPHKPNAATLLDRRPLPVVGSGRIA